MAACIVCNKQNMPDDLKDPDDLAKLRFRLEKVLDEVVPQGSVMCASCQFDLAQIEMYYALLTDFKKRYSETAKHLQSQDAETSRNIFHEAADCSSERLQSVIGEANLSQSVTTGLSVTSNITVQELPGNHIEVGKLQIVDVRTVKEELPENTSVETSSNNGATLSDHPEPTAVLAKKRERPRKNEKASETPSSSLIICPRKRGRPRKNDPTGPVSNNTPKASKKRGRPREGEASNAEDHGALMMPKTCQRTKEDELPASVVTGDPVVYVDTADQPENLGIEESESQTSMGGDSELEDVDQDFSSTSSETTIADDGSATIKIKQEKSRKEQDPPYSPIKCTSLARRRPGRPRKDEPGPPFECPICNKVFNKRGQFSLHARCHTEERPYVCSDCSRAFKDNSALQAHMKIHAGEKPFQCTTCGKSFLRKETLAKHSLAHTESRPFSCDQCAKKYKSQGQLQSHVKFVHEREKNFLCGICGMALDTQRALTTHRTKHGVSTEKPFKCSTCGKQYSTAPRLVKHEISHTKTGRQTFLCPICGREFAGKFYLSAHIQQHTGESNHSCVVCHKAFITADGCKRHMRVHRDERPHQCEECGKAFKELCSLKEHRMTHTDERPFTCSCGKGFRTKFKLHRHMKSLRHSELEPEPTEPQPLPTDVKHEMSA